MLSTSDILKVLPHKHPYLLVDRIIELHENEKVVGVKAVSYVESVFAGHYPGDPVLPGAMIIEASSQVAGFLVGGKEQLIGYVVEIKQFQFKSQVKPGCLLRIEAQKILARGPFLEAGIEVKTDDVLVACGTLLLYIKKQGGDSSRQTKS